MIQKKVVTNAGWIVACKLAQSVLNIIVGMLSARYLGPSGYGLISYAASIVAFVTPVMRLGLHAVLVQEITADPEQEGRTVGTALVMNVLSSLLCISAVIGFVFFANNGERDTLIVCSIYSFSLLFQATEMITYWFQAKLLSKYPSMAMLSAYVVVSCYKIYLLISAKSVYWFAFSNLIDHGLISLILISVYHAGKRQRLSYSGRKAKKLISMGKYYIVSSMMVTIFQQTDRLMLKNMMDESATGLYSAAVTCAGVFGFVYAAIIDSARPEILRLYRESKEEYEKSMSVLYCLIFYLSLAQCLAVALLAEPIIYILYGEAYLPAANALRLCVWYVTYAYFGSIRNIWILCEEKHRYVWIIDVFGALTNVALNYLLIPVYGIVGAAAASFATQFLTNFVLGFVLKPIRQNNKLLIRGLNPRFLLELRRLL